ncbi:hypothetical protein PPL_04652 [Heterostelium album PN500]|uniref:tRNA (guanine(46)-N(7))-methyltransferase n=1 Tax=Heterostelium pallidum (strain ATCC 26659 / Pp 5 / PN500) TaxID=670386 RepID=D3B861_HETP5|nr:hypothetical protein PPL_04652 [Heterostelium album PN500]EFA82229.1 hypothetical protein PPL_04652 [Heterostelium album PN500]|eukprot:XP_020434346.1 hypothetical protein PPL_04652 [Heterostelium album PN500]
MSKRLIIKNVPKALSKTDVIDRLKKLCHNSPAVTITIPITMPPGLELPAESTIAFLNINDITQLVHYKNSLHNKLIGENKIQVEIYEAPKPVVSKVVAQLNLDKKLVTTTSTSTSTTTTTTTTAATNTNSNKNTTTNNKPTTATPKKENNTEKKKSTETNQSNNKTEQESVKKNKILDNSNDNTREKKKVKLDNNSENGSKQQQDSEGNEQAESKKSEVTSNDSKDKKKDDIKEGGQEDGEEEEEEDEDEEESTTTTTTTTAATTPKQPTVRNNRKVITKITQQLVFLSEKKDFQNIRSNYNYLKKIGATPDHITYGVMLNACVRCQEYDMAKEVFNDALNTKNGANEVVYTTYIKALCETNMSAAEAMIDQMKQQNIALNARSYNSILRACIRSGDIAIANRLYTDMLKSNMEDSSTIEYLVKIYAEHLMIPEIWKLLGDKYEQFENEISPVVFSRLALAALLAGDLKSTVKALGIIDDILSKAPRAIATASQSHHKSQGKRSEHNKVSASLFERINRHEINEESERVRSCLQQLSKQQRKLKCLPMEQSKRVNFSPVTFKNLYEENKELEENKWFLDKLFKDSRDQESPRQVKMEICSGHGHWISKRAAQDLDADWLSVEIRYDRVFQIWSKLILDSIDNLYILAGEANSVLKNSVPSDSLDEVYINYPNPPVWPGAWRLINHDFLVDIHRTLKKDGTLTIVTDDQGYADSVVQLLKKSRKLAKIYKPVKEDYICQLDEDYGYSYFNKLWSNGQRMKRYCIYIIKD